MPNNAVLVVAGDFKLKKQNNGFKKYFGSIKRTNCRKTNFCRRAITETIRATYEDPNIQIPMVVAAYRTPSMKTRARVLDFISTILSDGKSSRLYKNIVDDKNGIANWY
jgi:predicted Zn-dependent peptidase